MATYKKRKKERETETVEQKKVYQLCWTVTLQDKTERKKERGAVKSAYQNKDIKKLQ